MPKKQKQIKFAENLLVGMSKEVETLLKKGGIEVIEFTTNSLEKPFILLICLESVVEAEELTKLQGVIGAQDCRYLTMQLSDDALDSFEAICNDTEGTARSHKFVNQAIFVIEHKVKINIMISFVHEAVGAQILINQELQAELAKNKGKFSAEPKVPRQKRNKEIRQGPNFTRRGKRIRVKGKFKSIPERIVRREQEEIDHANRIKSLPIDTEVIIKFGQRANESGKIYRIGRKYVGVKLENGDRWKFPFRNVDDRIDDNMILLTARSNRGLHQLFGSE